MYSHIFLQSIYTFDRKNSGNGRHISNFISNIKSWNIICKKKKIIIIIILATWELEPASYRLLRRRFQLLLGTQVRPHGRTFVATTLSSYKSTCATYFYIVLVLLYDARIFLSKRSYTAHY